MHIEIKSFFSGRALFAVESSSIKLALELAIQQGADLQGAHLRDAHLQGADLRGAHLQDAYLQGAHLQGADLQGADLQGAHLQDADLQGADLQDADLQGADLQGAHLLALQRLSIVPAVGAFEGFKQCREGRIVHLRIPAEAPRSSATGRKCRAAYVDVLAIDDGKDAVSSYDSTVIYRVGERVTCDRWEPNRWVECGGGIHFYLSRLEAEAHS